MVDGCVCVALVARARMIRENIFETNMRRMCLLREFSLKFVAESLADATDAAAVIATDSD